MSAPDSPPLGEPATTPPEPATIDPEILAAVEDVDRTLLRWSLGLSVRQRLRACTNAGTALARFRREPSRPG